MTEERKYAILFSATILAARKLTELGDKPSPAREACICQRHQQRRNDPQEDRSALANEQCEPETLNLEWAAKSLKQERPPFTRDGLFSRLWNKMGTKPTVVIPFFGLWPPQGQSNYQQVGGSVWESN